MRSEATQATRAPIPFRPDDAGAPAALRGVEARHAWGLIEGFGLTVAGDAAQHDDDSGGSDSDVEASDA